MTTGSAPSTKASPMSSHTELMPMGDCFQLFSTTVAAQLTTAQPSWLQALHYGSGNGNREFQNF